MIVKISKANMLLNYLPDSALPEGFSFFAAFDAGANTFCYVTDGMSNEIAVPFQVVGMPDNAINNMPRMVGIQLLDMFGLPHGQ